MSTNMTDFGPPSVRWPPYGVDALPVPVVLGAAGVASCLAAARWRRGRTALASTGMVLLAHAGIYLHTTLRGKLRIWERVLDHAGLKGDERLLDLGCGRGAVLIAAARRLPAGHAVGADLWSKDQSGNRPEATLANAARAGVADRVEVHTADMTALPFDDSSFDVVTSALAIHNIPSAEGRYRAVDEAMRVLRPGGQLIVADFWPMARKYAEHVGQGAPRGLGPGYWYGGPWLGATLLQIVKEHAARVQEQLRAAGSWDERFAIAEDALARRYNPKRVVDPEVTFCWAQMLASRGRLRVERLAADVGWSRKRLWSRLASQVGLTPKRATRLVRFDHAAHRLAAGDSPAVVAAESGYADQSHLHRDVQAFAGLTPTAVAVLPFLAVDDVAWPASGHRTSA
jgi:ubiquinone/menaquinone biosynthesis C-methylase UbiE